MILLDLIGCVLQMRNKVLQFSFCPLGSNRGRKMTFSRVVLSLKLHQQFTKKIYVLQMRYKVSEFSFKPEGSNEGRKTTFLVLCKLCHLIYIYIFRSGQLILQDMNGHVQQMCSKDSEFSFYSLRSYEGGKMTFSVV